MPFLTRVEFNIHCIPFCISFMANGLELSPGFAGSINARAEKTPGITTKTLQMVIEAARQVSADLLKAGKGSAVAEEAVNNIFGLDMSKLNLMLKDFGLTYQLREMDIGELKIDESYQRGETPLVRVIAEKFDPLAFGVVWVGNRKGQLYIVDGQQRTKGAHLAGHTKVPAVIFESKGQQQEADIFRKLNAWRRKVTRMDIFRAALQADVSYANEISQAVNSLGFELDLQRQVRQTRWPKIQAIAALEDIHDGSGKVGVERVLQTIGTCWEGQADALQTQFIKAVEEFHKIYGAALDEERMQQRLPSKTASEIVVAAVNDKASEQRKGVRVSMSTCIYDQLRKLYGKKPPASTAEQPSNEVKSETVGE